MVSNGNPLDRLKEARAQLDAARNNAQQSQFDASRGRRALRDVQAKARREDPEIKKAEAQLEKLEAQRVKQRAGVRAARDEYRDALVQWLGDDGTADFERLSAGFPILLFPTRIETRFFTGERT